MSLREQIYDLIKNTKKNEPLNLKKFKGMGPKSIRLIENILQEYLKSYTIDVAVTSKGTCILEVHNFTSCGLYSTIWGSGLIYAYKDGIDYLRNDNHKLEV